MKGCSQALLTLGDWRPASCGRGTARPKVGEPFEQRGPVAKRLPGRRVGGLGRPDEPEHRVRAGDDVLDLRARLRLQQRETDLQRPRVGEQAGGAIQVGQRHSGGHALLQDCPRLRIDCRRQLREGVVRPLRVPGADPAHVYQVVFLRHVGRIRRCRRHIPARSGDASGGCPMGWAYPARRTAWARSSFSWALTALAPGFRRTGR